MGPVVGVHRRVHLDEIHLIDYRQKADQHIVIMPFRVDLQNVDARRAKLAEHLCAGADLNLDQFRSCPPTRVWQKAERLESRYFSMFSVAAARPSARLCGTTFGWACMFATSSQYVSGTGAKAWILASGARYTILPTV